MLKFLFRVLIILILAVVVIGYTQSERIKRLLAVNSLFAEDSIITNFTSMDQMFLTQPMDSGTPRALADGPQMTLPDAWSDFVGERNVTALVVLRGGQIVHESYPQIAIEGLDARDLRRVSWSVAKSFVSVLTGILLEEGAIDSLDDPVTQYAPSLIGGAYDGASLRDVLQMSSGVTFDEDYLEFRSDINRMGRVLALGRSMDGFAEDLTETFAEPGAQWQYVSIDTHVIGMVLRGATGRTVPDLLGEKVLAPLGLEQEAYFVTDGYGVAFVLGGLNMTTRDYARFGLMVANGGVIDGTRIVSQAWIAESTAPSAPTEVNEIGYGYHWWVPLGSEPGQFLARGIYGQYIYVDQTRDVVVVLNSADRLFREDGVSDRNIAMLREIAEAAVQ